MTCKSCKHHEEMNDEQFYCSACNDIFPYDDAFVAENCMNFDYDWEAE